MGEILFHNLLLATNIFYTLIIYIVYPCLVYSQCGLSIGVFVVTYSSGAVGPLPTARSVFILHHWVLTVLRTSPGTPRPTGRGGEEDETKKDEKKGASVWWWMWKTTVHIQYNKQGCIDCEMLGWLECLISKLGQYCYFYDVYLITSLEVWEKGILSWWFNLHIQHA